MTQSMPVAASSPTPVRIRPGVVMTIGAFCGIIVSITQTMIVPLIPVLPKLLSASASNSAWVVTATLLTGAVGTPVFGRLGDMVGKRKMLLICMAILSAGSVMCAVSANLYVVIAGRGLQGASMGAIALGISIMRDELPPHLVGVGVARMSATMGVGGAIGLPVAAIVADQGSWQLLFWGTAVLSMTGFAAVWKVIPESSVVTPARFDYAGGLGFAVGLSSFLLVVSKGNDWGWTSPTTLILVAVTLVVGLIWVWWELRATAPLVNLRLAIRRQVLLTNSASVAVGFALFGMSLIPIQILMAPTWSGHGLGLTMIQAGLVSAPSGFMMFICSTIGARISAGRGPRVSLATGIVVLAGGYVVMLLARATWWQVMIATILTGAGIGIAYAAMPMLIMDAVPITDTAAANGLNSLMRSMGTSISAAVIGMLLATMATSRGLVSVPTNEGFTLGIIICLVGCVVALMMTLAVPRDHRFIRMS